MPLLPRCRLLTRMGPLLMRVLPLLMLSTSLAAGPNATELLQQSDDTRIDAPRHAATTEDLLSLSADMGNHSGLPRLLSESSLPGGIVLYANGRSGTSAFWDTFKRWTERGGMPIKALCSMKEGFHSTPPSVSSIGKCFQKFGSSRATWFTHIKPGHLSPKSDIKTAYELLRRLQKRGAKVCASRGVFQDPSLFQSVHLIDFLSLLHPFVDLCIAVDINNLKIHFPE